MSTLRLTQAVYAAIRAHGEQTYPDECCGALLGRIDAGGQPAIGGAGWRVEASVPAGNTRTDSAHNRYQIAPLELVKIEREARRQGLEIAGFYHSHPDHPAYWSLTDLAGAHWLGCCYVITAVAQGHAAVTNSFLLTGTSEEDKKFLDEPVEIAMNEAEIDQEKGRS
jgi:proteasome lid subunit RPN8/RPN11